MGDPEPQDEPDLEDPRCVENDCSRSTGNIRSGAVVYLFLFDKTDF